MRHPSVPQLASGLGFAHSLAIVIGIDQYGNGIPQLSTPVNDSRHLAQLLYDQMGYDVIHLTEPTKLDLIELFSKELPALVIPRIEVLVYFAGMALLRIAMRLQGSYSRRTPLWVQERAIWPWRN